MSGLSCAADAFFFFQGRTVFLNGAGVVKGFDVFFPGIHNGFVNVNGFDIAIEVIHQFNRNAGVNPFVYARHNVDNDFLVYVAVFLIKPKLVANERRTVGNAALAMGFNKKFTVNRQHRSRTSLNQRRAGIGRDGGNLAVADSVLGQVFEHLVPGFGLAAVFVKPNLVVAEDDAFAPVRALVGFESSFFLSGLDAGTNIVKSHFLE